MMYLRLHVKALLYLWYLEQIMIFNVILWSICRWKCIFCQASYMSLSLYSSNGDNVRSFQLSV